MLETPKDLNTLRLRSSILCNNFKYVTMDNQQEIYPQRLHVKNLQIFLYTNIC